MIPGATSERAWILILAFTSFCAGLAGGVVFSAERFERPEAGPFAAFEARMIETFDLDETRQRHLRYILEEYEDEIERLKETNIQDLEPDLVREGQRRQALIREWVVPPDRRQEFDTWAAGFGVEETPQ